MAKETKECSGKETVNFFDEIDKTCMLLISFGFSDVFNYGYSYFKLACDAMKQQQKLQIVSFATAISCLISKEAAKELEKM